MPKAITLSSDCPSDTTTISNVFIDRYLPRANGEFLKLYLYLLRWLPDSSHPLSLGSIADTFFMTENDVKRGLKYWEQEGLLQLKLDAEGTVSAIRMKNIMIPEASHASMQSGSPSVSADGFICSLTDASENSKGKESFSQPETAPRRDSRQAYSMRQLESFSATDNGKQLLFIIQQYLGHPLSQTDLNTIYYFHDALGFSTDLIEYLFEYCVSNGHTHMRYIEKVALSWSSRHITTAEEARNQGESYQNSCFAVLKAFGLSNRMPTPGEAEYVNKWIHSYGFSLELVLEACRRTMMAVHTPSFEYADKILSNWKNAGLFTMAEITAADKAHSAKKAASAPKPATRQTRSASNKFHNFNQRSYDYDALEKKLSQKIRAASGDVK